MPTFLLLSIISGIAAVLSLLWMACGSFPPQSSRYFAIQVVGKQTGRGVPMVELQTTNNVCYYIAERLYRITGQGIYRDTIMLGRQAPIPEPLFNAKVTGQDSVLTALYGGKLYWFYGDTSRLSYVLGNFAMSGATSDLPNRLDH